MNIRESSSPALLTNFYVVILYRAIYLKDQTMQQSLFGTDGIRNHVGTPPFTIHELPRLACAYASWLIDTYQLPLTVALADDTRASAIFIKDTFQAALHAYGISTYNAGILTTPALIALISKNQNIDAGIMISASHNPHTDNGIKFIAKQGKKIDLAQEAAITDRFNQPDIQGPDYQSFGTHQVGHTAAQEYIALIVGLCTANFARNLTIVVDCADGAASHLAPAIFRQLGAQVIAIHNRPNGTNINDQCGSLYPQALQHHVIAYQADIGFAFDGDGDRVIAVSKDGSIKTGDDLLALLTHHPAYAAQQAIIGTIMSNQGLHQYLHDHGKTLIRTAVGDAHVVAALEQKNLLLGGEPSGHIITRDYLDAADGIVTALRILETVIHTHNWTLETFTPFPQKLINLTVRHKRNLQDPHIDSIIQKHQSLLKQGRLVVRYSGTEPLLRIMVEEQNLADAQVICQQLADALNKELN